MHYFFCHFILLIVCFCPSMSRIGFSSSNSSSIFQFKFLMQWRFLSSYYDIAMIFILVFSLFLYLDGYFPCYRKTKSYHLNI
jgi:hypothetical protein